MSFPFPLLEYKLFVDPSFSSSCALKYVISGMEVNFNFPLFLCWKLMSIILVFLTIMMFFHSGINVQYFLLAVSVSIILLITFFVNHNFIF